MVVRISCLVWLIAVAGAAGWQETRPARAAGVPPVVAVESSPGAGERIYRIADQGCAFSWTVYTGELNRGVVKSRAACALPLSRQIPYLGRLLAEFVAKDPDAPSFHTLFWGGLVPESGPSSHELPRRLALAAHRSRGWDAARGRPTAGDVNRYIKDLANSEPIYPELVPLFAAAGRSLSIASVEKVRVLPAGRLPFYEELSRAGVEPTEKLPFDCLVWFSVSVEPGPPLTSPLSR